jgi:lipooligosaccharide transport system ATP-binding protein
MTDRPAIEAKGLTKRFGALTAVDDIDFAVSPGECFGVLGPNGAGKTSTIRMICCVSPVTSGSLRVLGMDPGRDARRIKYRLGVVPQEDNLDSDLSVLENLLAYARYFDIPRRVALERASAALTATILEEKVNETILNLSGGMRRRLTLARALISEPELLVLDEPTTGLDPQARHQFWQRLRQLKREGLTMLLTTHYMEEAAQLCDRVVIMDQSRIIAAGSPAELVKRHAGMAVTEVRINPERGGDLETIVASLAGEYEVETGLDTLFLYARTGTAPRDLDLAWLGDGVEAVVHRSATLEDVFLRLTGRDLLE